MSSNLPFEVKSILENCISDMNDNVHLFCNNPGVDFTRDRKLGFTNLVSLILSMGSKGIRRELKKYFKNPKERANPNAFLKARKKLNNKVFPYLLEQFNKSSMSYDTRLYKDYQLLAVDGSDFNIAKNTDSESYIDGEGNIMHLNAVCDIANNVFLAILIEPKSKCDERKACLTMIKNMTFPRKAILTADRGYPDYEFFETINRKENLDYLIRVPNKWSKATKSLPMKELDRDIVVEIRTTQRNEDKEAYRNGTATYLPGPSKFGKPKKEVAWTFGSPYKLSLRVVRFEIADGVYETIITSLNRFEFPIKEIKKLYHKRWQIETNFRYLKYNMYATHFHSKSEDFSIQEIYARIIMYNFSMRIMMNIEIKQKEEWKHFYQINFTNGFDACMKYWRYRGESPPDIIADIQSEILPVRPGRKDKRKIKPKFFIPFLYRTA